MKRLPFRDSPAVADSWLLNLEWPHAGDDLAFRQMAVADHLAVALLILEMFSLSDPRADFGFDGSRQHLLRSRSKNFTEDISRCADWKTDRRTANFSHGGVLLGENKVLE